MTTDEKPRTRAKSVVLTPTTRRIINASAHIQEALTHDFDYQHAIMCQVGLPRKRTDEKVFARKNGGVHMELEAGKLWNGKEMQEQSLPYGPCPRLVMVHISTEAIKTKSRDIDIGNSVHQFLKRLGMPTTGGKRGGYTTFRKQMAALAACRLTFGFTSRDGRVLTVDAKPIDQFEAWIQHDDQQTSFWPGRLQLSQQFYDTLTEHAVPLDPRALAALSHSALGLDIYSFLAHRLCRIRNNGVMLSWKNLMEQFGQEYNDFRNFKQKFLTALRQVRPVYPDAKLEVVRGGLKLYSSPPPIPKTQVLVELPSKGEYVPWKDRVE